MKIIHCADLHLDSAMESSLTAAQAKIRRDELLDAYERMVSYAEDQGVSVILLCGDVFDKPHIRKAAKERFLDQIRLHPDIDFLYLQGNHDRADFFSELSEEEFPANLKLFSRNDWTAYDYGDVVITGREIDESNQSTIAMDLILDGMKTNIVMLHGEDTSSGAANGGYSIDLSSLRGRNIDYLALGHIHSYRCERLDDRGVCCYSGCLEGRGFDELGEKGFVLLSVEDGKIESTFIPTSRRVFRELEIPVVPEDTMADIAARVEEQIQAIPGKDLVKVVFTGHTDMDFDIDRFRIGRMLSDRFFYDRCEDRTSAVIDYDSFAKDHSLKGEFVRLMQEKEPDEQRRALIIEIGVRAIMGEEIEE